MNSACRARRVRRKLVGELTSRPFRRSTHEALSSHRTRDHNPDRRRCHGNWTGTLTPTGGEPVPAHLVLKQEAGKLTGTAGRDSNQQRPIQNGKAGNGNLTFEVATDNAVMKFSLKQEGDEISGDVTREREGQTQTAKLAVKRTN